jgi:hypothetical protein
MRTNIDIDDELMQQAMEATQTTTKKRRSRPACVRWCNSEGRDVPEDLRNRRLGGRFGGHARGPFAGVGGGAELAQTRL